MKAKRWLCVLLSLVLCLQLLPTVAFAATTYSIEVEQTVMGGTASIEAPSGEGITIENGKVSGLTDPTQFVTATATPNEGMVFIAWTVQKEKNSSWGIATTNNRTLETGYTLNSNPLKIAISTRATASARGNLKLIPVFVAPVQLTAVSADSEKGGFAGTNSAAPGGEAVTLTASPKEGCTFTGCTLTYTEDGTTVPAADYTLRINENTVTLALGAKVTKAVTVMGHFVDAAEPNFIVPGMDLSIWSGGNNAAVVTGCDNDLDEKVVVTFKTINAAQGIMIYLKRYNSTDKTYSPYVADGVTFDFSQTESITRNDTNTTIVLKGEGLSTLLEIPFTVKDGRDNTKAGVIRMELANRVQLKTKWGNVEDMGAIVYNGQEYPSKSVIDFPVGMTEDIVMTGGVWKKLNTDFIVNSWEISDGVTTTTQDGGTLTLSPSMLDKFLTITAIYSKTYGMEVDNTAEHGTVTIRSGDDPAASNGKLEKLLPGTSVTVTATTDEGYEFYGWQV